MAFALQERHLPSETGARCLLAASALGPQRDGGAALQLCL